MSPFIIGLAFATYYMLACKLSLEDLEYDKNMLHYYTGLKDYRRSKTVYSTLDKDNIVYKNGLCLQALIKCMKGLIGPVVPVGLF